jgi:uncharacterized membrane protein YtjA (UPF0391 family)
MKPRNVGAFCIHRAGICGGVHQKLREIAGFDFYNQFVVSVIPSLWKVAENLRQDAKPYERIRMLQWTITFLILALIAGLLGFGGVAGTAATIAKVLFVIFLVLLVVSALTRALKGKTP